MLAIIGGGGVAAYNNWSDHGWPLRSRATTLDTADVTRKAVKLATRASAKASVAASQVGVTISEGALIAPSCQSPRHPPVESPPGRPVIPSASILVIRNANK